MEKGKCHICGQYKDLTFEHLPPNKAYNDHRVKVINGEDILGKNQKPWDYENVKFKYIQKGSGLHSLCESCNNNMGAWYGDEYIKISNSILEFVLENDLEKATAYEFKFNEIYPLRFLKQVVSMFASTFPEDMISSHNDLKKFLLDKNYNVLDKNKYRISMYILKTPKNAWTGINVMGNIYTNTSKMVASLDLFPLGFEFEFNPEGKAENLDITEFANNYGYDDKVSADMLILTRERNTMFPCDYRTKEEIEEQYRKNKEKVIKLIKAEVYDDVKNKQALNTLIKDYQEDRINSKELYEKVIELKKEKR